MNSTDLDLHRKTGRELRLRWQSAVVLVVVLLPVVIGLLLRTLPVLTPASAEGLAICAAFGLLVWLLHAATPFAAVTGFLLTTSLYLGTVAQPQGGWFHTALLPRTGALRPRLRGYTLPTRPERKDRPRRIPPRPPRLPGRRQHGHRRSRSDHATAV